MIFGIEFSRWDSPTTADQTWPDIDEYPTDDCPDQRWPNDAPDVMGWDRLSSNPVKDVLAYYGQLMAQAGIYVPGAQLTKPAVPDELLGWEPSLPIWIDELGKFADPYVETPQTRADVLAWRRNRSTGPPVNIFAKRGKKKK